MGMGMEVGLDAGVGNQNGLEMEMLGQEFDVNELLSGSGTGIVGVNGLAAV